MLTIPQPDRETIAAERLLPLWVIFALVMALGVFELGPDLIGGLQRERGWLDVPLALSMFAVGCLIRSEDVLLVLSRLPAVGVGVALQCSIMPIVAWSVVRVWGAEGATAQGLMVLGCLPPSALAPVLSAAGRGHVAYAAAVATLGTLLLPLTLPLACFAAGEAVPGLSLLVIVRTLVGVMVLPLLLGHLLARSLPELNQLATDNGRLLLYFPALGYYILDSALASIVRTMWSVELVAAVLLITCAGLGLGYLSGRVFLMERPLRRSLGLAVGVPHTCLGVALLSRAWPGRPDVLAPLLIAGVLSVLVASVVCSYWSQWVDHRSTPGR